MHTIHYNIKRIENKTQFKLLTAFFGMVISVLFKCSYLNKHYAK